jgi:hypothetical protein
MIGTLATVLATLTLGKALKTDNAGSYFVCSSSLSDWLWGVASP